MKLEVPSTAKPKATPTSPAGAAAAPAGPPLASPLDAPPGLKPLGALAAGTPSQAGPAPTLVSPASLFSHRGAFGDTGLVKIPGQPDRRYAAGAGEPGAETLPEALHNIAQVQTRMLQAMERRHQDEEKVAQKGTLGAITRSEELDVYLARGCDTLDVEVCGSLLGRELFHGLKRACDQAKHVMQAVKFPTTVSNRLAYGVASMSWGAETTQVSLSGPCQRRTSRTASPRTSTATPSRQE